MSNMLKKGVSILLNLILDLTMKIWDIGGQFQYRQNWVDYAKNVDVIVFMIDGSNVRLNKYFINIYSMILCPWQKKNYIVY